MSQLSASGSQSIGVSASTSVLPMNTQDWSRLGWTGWISFQSKGLTRVFCNTTVQKHQFFKKIKSDTVSTVFPSISQEVMGPDAMIFVFWMLSFKQLFHSPPSLSSRGFLAPLYFLPLRVVSSAYLRLLIFLPTIWIPAFVSSSPAFLMMYSTYKLNKQGDNIQLWRTPFPIWNQSVVPCPVLTVAS